MTWFRQYIAPVLIVLVFLVALLAVSSRIFLPNDMAAPAPIEEVDIGSWHSQSPFLLGMGGMPPAALSLVISPVYALTNDK